jgi:FtsP/CotA-like multicopper oxidase with cupredoxin domain
MYHVHSEPGHELAQGLYGAFLVMPPGDEWDPETDRIFVLGSRGAERFSAPAINGRVEPDPVEVRPGVAYRLRFMHISPDDDKRVTLLRDGEPIEWTPVAKDGADLPPPLVRAASADFSPRVGETFDFVWTPDAAGDFTLRVVTRFPNGPPAFPSGDAAPHTADVVVRVR